MNFLSRFRPDGFTTALVAMVLIATLLPCRGNTAQVVGLATNLAIGLVFFLHGARLSRNAAIAGATHWRLHAVVFTATFILFPLLGVAVEWLLWGALPAPLILGVLFLCTLPSTVQSSIAFTSIAGGNIPAAIFSASASSMIGVVLTPLLIGILARVDGGGLSLASLDRIALQLVLPFVAGQVLHPWFGRWMVRNRTVLSLVDRGSILLIVYSAFSEAVVNGLWHQLSPAALAVVLTVEVVLLAVVLTATTYGSRLLGFSRADEITIVFCGSKKSLASGIPIASILFPAHLVGMIVLPVMLFHQMQLIVCAMLARSYARRAGLEGTSVPADEAAVPVHRRSTAKLPEE
ncbi:MAG: solute carrier family 10 (sodium/bile acid cotransporter), er 7 [Rhodospirillaceae bacterium]|jgi:sodium/bile acid cotransporter 7|nr:solute carrier family 10 (sodium/bile acid cotransporter), er 7 [Rhodospirillaceae bacterium]